MALVDVVIPTRNRFDLTLTAARSVQDQTFSGWELWIIDDGSDDGSDARLAEALTEDDRIHVVSRLRSGPQGARTYGVSLGSAPWVALLDSDDVWLPDKLLSQLDLSDDADIVLCWHEWFRSDGSVRSTSRPRPTHPVSPFLTNNMSTPLINRRFLASRGGTKAPHGLIPTPSCDNIELFLRLLPSARVAVAPSVLVRCRDHPGERSSDSSSSRAGAVELAAVVDHHARALEPWPRERASMLAQVGARMMAADEYRTGFRRFAEALRASPGRHRLYLVRRYAPFALKSMAQRLLRHVRPTSTTLRSTP